MNHLYNVLAAALVAGAGASAGLAQQPTAPAEPDPTSHSMPAAKDLEPAVDTSAPSQGSTDNAPRASAPPSATRPAVTTTAPTGHPAPRGDTATAAAPAASKAAAPARGARAMDRLDLETTEITGNRELPKVLYIVPWKRADLGDIVGKPVNSLLDEVLEPVDRDVFRRENRYYSALQSETPEAAAPAPPK